MRRSASVRVGILLAVSSLLSCSAERPPERRCVDGDGRFVDEGLCREGAATGEAARPGAAGGATGDWEAGPPGATGPSGPSGPAVSRGGFHFIWIPYGAFGGLGTQAPGYVGRQAGAGDSGGHGTSSVTRGGFGATGAAHATPATAAS